MSTTVNLEDQEDELKFQEFPLTPEPPRRTSKTLHDDFVEFGNSEEQEELLKEDNKPKPSFVEFAYYQSFCNVDTSQVLQRILWSMVPASGRNTFLNQHIKSNPDLYGPFWISVTLVFSIAISSNIADYLSSAGRTNRIWHYDFHKVTIAAITIFSYIFFIPLLLWTLLKYNTARGVRYTFLEILCAYGYSIFIYIPISILWVIQIPTLQWILVILGAALSGSVLVKSFWPALRHANIKIGILVLSLILLFHTLLAASFVLYFFKPTPIYGEDIQPPKLIPVAPPVQENVPISAPSKIETKAPTPEEKLIKEAIISPPKVPADKPSKKNENDAPQPQNQVAPQVHQGDKSPVPPISPQVDPSHAQSPKVAPDKSNQQKEGVHPQIKKDESVAAHDDQPNQVPDTHPVLDKKMEILSAAVTSPSQPTASRKSDSSHAPSHSNSKPPNVETSPSHLEPLK